MSAGEKREFNSLAAKGFAWAATKHQSTNSVAPEKVGNFFGLEAFRNGQFPPARRDRTRTNDNVYAQAGMAFLSSLNDDQMRALRNAVSAQMKALGSLHRDPRKNRRSPQPRPGAPR